MRHDHDDVLNRRDAPHDSSTEADGSLLPWPRWEPRSAHTLRRRPDHEVADLLCRQLASMAVAVAKVCGPESATTRLVTRAAYGSATDAAEKLRKLRLARYALDELSPRTQERIRSLAARLREQGWSDIDQLLEDSTLIRPRVAVSVEDPTVLDRITATLRPYGFRVYAANRTTLENAPATDDVAPALVIMDLLDQDGDLIRAALDLVHRQVPVLVLCGLPVESTTPALRFLNRAFGPEERVSAVFRSLR